MYLFVECWKARKEWFELTSDEQAAYMAELGKGIGELIKAGVEIVSWTFNDPSTSKRAPYDYVAVWKFPTQEFAAQFEQIVEGSGWYNYFDQINLKGKVSTPEACIGQMIGVIQHA